MAYEEVKPTLKLIAKRDFEFVKEKYGYFDEETKNRVESEIAGAKPLDVLALTTKLGSGLKILDVKILNEENEDVFIELLVKGVSN